jgi:DNA-binding NarL/FixJ family response regulator
LGVGGGLVAVLHSLHGTCHITVRRATMPIKNDQQFFSNFAQQFTDLSARQQQVATLVCQKLSNKEIAAKLGFTEGTVRIHLHAIYARLGIHSRTQLMIALSDHCNSKTPD